MRVILHSCRSIPIFISIAIAPIFCYGQRFSNGDESIEVGRAYSIRPRIKLPVFDSTNNSSSYRFQYLKQSQLVDLLLPFYDREICEPGNKEHSIYQEYMKKGNELLPEAKREFIKRFLDDKLRKDILRGLLKDTSALRKCTIKLVPVYYLTFNAASYKKRSERKFKSLFNLDTIFYHYQVTMNKLLIYRFDYKHKIFKGPDPITSLDSVRYKYSMGLGKEIIGICASMRIRSVGGYAPGYVDDGDKLNVIKSSSRYPTINNCKSYYAKSIYINDHNFLMNRIYDGYKAMVKRNKVKPFPGISGKD